jgi:hypothetical protein
MALRASFRNHQWASNARAQSKVARKFLNKENNNALRAQNFVNIFFSPVGDKNITFSFRV